MDLATLNLAALNMFPLRGGEMAIRLPDNRLFHFDTGVPVSDYHNKWERTPNAGDRQRIKNEGFPAPMLPYLLHPANSQALFPETA